MTTVGLQSYFDAAQQNRRAAHACASPALNWVVVPWKLHDGRKVPTRTKWQQAGALRGAEVAEWWANNPQDIPGVVCGSESGVWVLDIDPRNGGDESIGRLDAVGALGNTFRVSTPGGGWHLYFVWPGGEVNIPTVVNLPGYPGIDVKGTGGWAAAPGAVVEIDGEFKEYGVPVGGAQILSAPDWLIEIVRGDGPNWSTGQDWSETDGTEDPDALWLNWELDSVGSTPPGSQHEAFRRFVMQMRVRGMKKDAALSAAIEVCNRFVAGRDPWTESDAESMVNGTWARIAPQTVDAQLDAWAQSQTPTTAVGEAPLPPNVMPPPAVLLSPPVPAAVVVTGEPPKYVGPDDENAQDLLTFARDRLLWVRGQGRDGWMFWNGVQWEHDIGLQKHEVARQLAHDFIKRAAICPVEDERKKLMARTNRLGTVQGRDACFNYAQDLFGVDADKLDSDPMVLNTRSGLVDLRTGEIRPSRSTDFVSRITACEFNQERDETWEKVVQQSVTDAHDRAWLQRWMGYCLTGLTTEKKILAMHGPANSGKSTVTEPLARALGSYAISWDADTIIANSDVNKQEALYRARGTRLVVVNEMKAGTKLDAGMIKSATGTDTVTARALYHGSINYRPQFKLWIHTNHVPNARDDALLERLMFFGMSNALDRSQRDPGVKAWLEEGAGPAVIWWAMQGLLQMMQPNQKLGRPQHSDEEMEDHALRSDPIRRFIADMLEPVPDNMAAPWEGFIAAYQQWCLNEGLKPMGSTTFAHALKERGIVKSYEWWETGLRSMGVKGWQVRSSGSVSV